MRLHALFVPALFVLHAHAASIPESVPLLEESSPTKPLDKILLRDAPTEIPVKVIEGSQPAENLISLEDENYQVKRAEVDLSNLSPPKHQNEHDTQSPEKYNDDKISESTIKQSLSETQNVFNQGLQTISQNVQTFFTENDQVTALQNSIQNMKESLAEQIKKLNSTIQNFWNLQGSSTRSTFDTEGKNSPIYKVQCDLKKLEETFQERLNSLSNSVQEAANLRQSLRADANGASPQPAAGTTGETQNQNPSNFITVVMNSIQNIQQQWNQGINNISNQFQSFFNQGQPSSSGQGDQSNGSAPSSANPQSGNTDGSQGIGSFVNGIWQNFQTIINPNGQGTTQTQQSPSQNNNNIFSGLQNIPFVQGVVNFFNPNRQPETTPVPTTTTAKPVGQNVVPGASQEYDSVENNKKKPLDQPLSIQRIQGSVTPVVMSKDAAEVETAEVVTSQGELKYGFGPKPHGGGGDNNDSNGSRVKDIPLETLATADVQPDHLVQPGEVATDHGRSLRRFY